jgi:hypothetical protein
LRTADGGEDWTRVAINETEEELYSVAFTPDARQGWAVGSTGMILRTLIPKHAPRLLRPFSVKQVDDYLHPDVQVDPADTPTNAIRVQLRLEGVPKDGDFSPDRDFSLGGSIKPWRASQLGPGRYVCDIELCDGWNIVPAKGEFGAGPLAQFIKFMGWTEVAKSPVKSFKEHGAQNLALLVVAYAVGMLGLYLGRPWWLVLWHEKLASLTGALPWVGGALKKVSGLAGLLLVASPRCLDAVVKEHAATALSELEKLPEAGTRRVWVAAPLQVNDEVFGTPARPFAAPVEARPGTLYVRGLTELCRHLIGKRWWLAIEGPGGVGKSALAFQLARWFATPEAPNRLNLPQAIPIFVRSPKEGLDQEVLAELKRVLGLPRMSTHLSDALLVRRRVLALLDGVSEKVTNFETLLAGPLNPAKGAQLTHLVVVTSRRRMAVAECTRVLPSSVDLGSMDGVLNRYLEDVVGAGRFTSKQREAIREALKGIMEELSKEGGHPPEIPMVFLKLIVQRADKVLANAESTVPQIRDQASLPHSLAELVDAYMGNLLENSPDVVEQALRARKAALACIGDDGLPSWRPLAGYERKGLKLDQIEALVTAGLMIKDSADVGDPLFKFALDPIAEYLAAKELVLALRDGTLDLTELGRIRASFSQESDVSTQISRIGRAYRVRVD